MSVTINDLEAVTALVQLYIHGAAGDVAKLKEAFHPTATMMGHIGPMDTYIPITDFFSMIENSPPLPGLNYKAVIRSIDLTGDAGVAVLTETDYMGCDFVNYFAVTRIDGRWWITHKNYAHTGGQPPSP